MEELKGSLYGRPEAFPTSRFSGTGAEMAEKVALPHCPMLNLRMPNLVNQPGLGR